MIRPPIRTSPQSPSERRVLPAAAVPSITDRAVSSDRAGVSAYAAQIAHFFSTFRAISSRSVQGLILVSIQRPRSGSTASSRSSPPLLAVLDSADPHASKPILPRHLRRRSRPGPGAGDARATALQPRDQLELRTVLERFCDWVGSVEASAFLSLRFPQPLEQKRRGPDPCHFVAKPVPGGIGQDEALDAPVRYLLAGHTTKPTFGAATERERSGLEFRIDPSDPRSGRGRQIEVVS